MAHTGVVSGARIRGAAARVTIYHYIHICIRMYTHINTCATGGRVPESCLAHEFEVLQRAAAKIPGPGQYAVAQVRFDSFVCEK